MSSFSMPLLSINQWLLSLASNDLRLEELEHDWHALTLLLPGLRFLLLSSCSARHSLGMRQQIHSNLWGEPNLIRMNLQVSPPSILAQVWILGQLVHRGHSTKF
uniref:Uncharacterized protein n=1 Tax=Nephroselmis olivacea TaxID=31312 RepID=Q9T463_NEPOL|nr:hypothetical protein NeolCp098 [Nephroselmis olivacea]NP_050944.1 hypothetical protein NeolCp139 [Nephroselmis olivacea]AAD54874.1 unknown [Nephroselmis olivacea]AAD54915.1 unknown [Nephroselmis olivacea]